jgi:hypothetical protein
LHLTIICITELAEYLSKYEAPVNINITNAIPIHYQKTIVGHGLIKGVLHVVTDDYDRVNVASWF